jgi:hypothetical protein
MYPLKYLRKHQMTDKGADSPILGMNAMPFGNTVGKVVRVGDECIFYKAGEHLYNPNVPQEMQTPCE